MNKKGQLTIFIIIAILVIAAVVIYLLVRNPPSIGEIPSEFKGIYDSFSVCMEDVIVSGARALESQGGYIYAQNYAPGSEFMPFSSHLNFLGNPIPYWYYVSGNNIQNENVPSLNSMESELEKFVNSNAVKCVPENLDAGYELDVGDSDANVVIRANEIQLNLEMNFDMIKEDKTSSIKNHRITVSSELGDLYENAVAVYKEEQKNLFLENYSIDVLNSYAPVDGVEFSCMPKVWGADEVFSELEVAIEENIKTLNSDGPVNNYFVIDSLKNKLSGDVYVRFLNSKDWSKTYEVDPSQGPIMIANPVGAQQGLGVLGFCYIPYHFVYDMKYPVMIQVYSKNTDEIFQFPFAVVVENNNPREPISGSASSYEGSGICENKNTEYEITTSDFRGNPVDAQIYYECFSDSCFVGDSENGMYSGMIPQCVNGNIIARANGYRDSEVLVSSINSGSVEVIMDKKYELNINLKLDSQEYNGEALIYFTNGDFSEVVSYPSIDSIKLSRGDYEVSVYTYKNASLALGASTQQYCVEIPRTFGGSFGLTKKECYDVQVPESVVTRALSGGGKGSVSISEGDLTESNEILINAESLPEPDSLNAIQENYVLYESKTVEVMLR